MPRVFQRGLSVRGTKHGTASGGVPPPFQSSFVRDLFRTYEPPPPPLLRDFLSVFSPQRWGFSGWYDGSEWFKPPDIRARDEMLNNYEVQPAVDRLKA